MDLYVRVKPKSGVGRFYRCMLLFGAAWAVYAVDPATAKRLRQEQMLEVSDTKPADFVDPDTSASESKSPAVLPENAGADPKALALGEGAPKPVPTDPAERLHIIRNAIAVLDLKDASLWTASNKPKTEALEKLTGWPISAAERDSAFGQTQA